MLFNVELPRKAYKFCSDTGRIDYYRSQLWHKTDVGNAYVGSVISPYYDSLLVKFSSSRAFDAIKKAIRAIKEIT